MQPFRELLETDRILVVDGAMGTMLYAKGVYINRCYDELNLSNPDLVREIHSEYIRAGADIIETNTFGATAHKLQQYGLSAVSTKSTLSRHASRVKPLEIVFRSPLRLALSGCASSRTVQRPTPKRRRCSRPRPRPCSKVVSICFASRRFLTSPKSVRPSTQFVNSAIYRSSRR